MPEVNRGRRSMNNNVANTNISERLAAVVERYREAGIAFGAHVPRIADELSFVIRELSSPVEESTVVDIGAGIGFFAPACVGLGFKRVIVVDDFGDSSDPEWDRVAMSVHRQLGIEVVQADVSRDGLPDIGDVDVCTTFASLEHWHHNPRRVFRQMAAALRRGGVCAIGAPNCANLRKRLAAPFGSVVWTPLEQWYGPEIFRGHVREPNLQDLRVIALDMGLERIRTYGRNWSGLHSRDSLRRVLTGFVDKGLRLWPSGCADIYVTGVKP